MERLRGMTITPEIPALRPATRRNIELATELVQRCFGPARPEEFARFTDNERARFMFAATAAAFPDARLSVDWMTADDRRVAIGGRFCATHGGEWRGVGATGRRVDVMCIATLAVVNERVVDVSVVTDSLTMAEQLGAVQPLAPKACQVYDAAPDPSKVEAGEGMSDA
jgi:hypothetical protein